MKRTDPLSSIPPAPRTHIRVGLSHASLTFFWVNRSQHTSTFRTFSAYIYMVHAKKPSLECGTVSCAIRSVLHTYQRIFSKPHIPMFAMQVYFAQSWLSLDINTLITTSLSLLNAQDTGLCQGNLNKTSVSHIFRRFMRFPTIFKLLHMGFGKNASIWQQHLAKCSFFDCSYSVAQ